MNLSEQVTYILREIVRNLFHIEKFTVHVTVHVYNMFFFSKLYNVSNPAF